ncbi:MAG: Lin0512 family protein [Pseudomonadota bacterium]
MTEQRVIIEMGTGTDLHGQDYTKAAIRAVEDAIRHASLPLFQSLGIDHQAMRVSVTVGVAAPDAVALDRVAAELPRGRVEVRAVAGGLDVVNPETGEVTVVATAAVEAFLPAQIGWRLASGED